MTQCGGCAEPEVQDQVCVEEEPEVYEPRKANPMLKVADEYVRENAILDSDDHIVTKELWDNRFRVNVWKYNPNRIAQSFFVRVGESGVVECNPQIGA